MDCCDSNWYCIPVEKVKKKILGRKTFPSGEKMTKED
jgi:hypothetical protein